MADAPAPDPTARKGRCQGLILLMGAPRKGRDEGCTESLATKHLFTSLSLWYLALDKSVSQASFPPSFLHTFPHFHLLQRDGCWVTSLPGNSEQTCSSTLALSGSPDFTSLSPPGHGVLGGCNVGLSGAAISLLPTRL